MATGADIVVEAMRDLAFLIGIYIGWRAVRKKSKQKEENPDFISTHSRNNWVVGAILAPPIMAALAVFYNYKHHHKIRDVLYTLFLMFVYPFLLLFFMAYIISMLGESMFMWLVFFAVMWVVPGRITLHYWNKLPDKIKTT